MKKTRTINYPYLMDYEVVGDTLESKPEKNKKESKKTITIDEFKAYKDKQRKKLGRVFSRIERLENLLASLGYDINPK